MPTEKLTKINDELTKRINALEKRIEKIENEIDPELIKKRIEDRLNAIMNRKIAYR